jgi:6-pyruvoyltetrahydropterin/6-carboxytetrahydropterin synthase
MNGGILTIKILKNTACSTNRSRNFKKCAREGGMFLIKEFEFDSAHFLPAYKGKCEALHGHTYKLAVKLEGAPNKEGMVMDFAELKKTVTEKVIDLLDHTCLNDLLPQPSAENVVVWIWDALCVPLRRDNCALYELELWETRTSGVVYRGEQL